MGSVTLARVTEDHRALFVLEVTTRGDDAYFEVYDSSGGLCASCVAYGRGRRSWHDDAEEVRDRCSLNKFRRID